MAAWRSHPRLGARSPPDGRRAWPGADSLPLLAAAAAPAAGARARWPDGCAGRRATGPPARPPGPSRSTCRVSSLLLRSHLSEFLVQLPLSRCEPGRDDDLHLHVLVAAAAAFQPGHAVSGQPEHAPARRLGRDLHRDLPLESRHGDLGSEGGIAGRDGQLHMEVIAAALEAGIGPHGAFQVEVAPARARPATRPFGRHADPGARLDARRNLHLEMAAAFGPARATARRARLAADVAGATAGAARLVQFERQRLA